MRRSAATAFLLVLTAVCSRGADGPRDDGAVLLYTGESHAAALPCKCPVRPDGGFARRASLIARLRSGPKSPVIVVDAGGFFAGGIYDENTRGAKIDRIRTALATKAMAAMNYDAIAIGDDELGLGEDFLRELISSKALPLVSANLLDSKTGKPVAKPWIIVDRGGLKAGLFGLTTTEAQIAINRGGYGLRVAPPGPAAAKAVAQLRKAGIDLIVALSHLGESESEALARSVKGIDILINGHRKRSNAPSFMAGRTTILQFDFEARQLGVCALSRSPRSWNAATKFKRLSRLVPDDPAVARLVAQAQARMKKLGPGASRVVADLYTRPECPYSRPAELKLIELARELPQAMALNVHYILHRDDDGKLSAMHGESELAETRRQAIIREFHPKKLPDYLKQMRSSKAGWEDAARAAGVVPARIRGAMAAGEADDFLAPDLHRAERLGIDASPSLYLNNVRYEGPFTRGRLLAALCSSLPKAARPRPCDDVPECFGDLDCDKPGYVGECIKPGTRGARCKRYPATKVALTLIEDPAALHSGSDKIVDSLLTFMPGLKVKRIGYNSPAGKALAGKHKLRRLPGYIMGLEARRARRFDRVSGAVSEVAGALVMREALVGSHQLMRRKRAPGQLELFIAPHARQAYEVVTAALKGAPKRDPKPDVRIRYSVYIDGDGKLAMRGGIAEIEEALRQIAVRERFGDKFPAYLEARSRAPGSSYWRAPLRAVGIDPDVLKGYADSPWATAMLRADAEALKMLSTGGPTVFFTSNQEVYPVSGRDELARLLDQLSAEISRTR